MGIFENTSLAPSKIWASTQAKIEKLGLSNIRGCKEGATGFVFKANEHGSDRVVAVKVIKDPDGKFTKRNGTTLPIMNYFRNERRMLAKLQDCQVVPKYYYSVSPSSDESNIFQPFHVMEYVNGTCIKEYINELSETERTESRLADLFLKIIQATAKFHERGVVHRDLAPKNILVTPTEDIWLIDVGESCPEVEEHSRTGETVMGQGHNPHPEWVRKTIRHDIYDLCRIGFTIFTGQWPDPNHEDEQDWSHQLKSRNAPAWISKIILKGMRVGNQKLAYDATVWNTAEELESAIESHYSEVELRKKKLESRRRRTWSLATIAMVAFVLLLIGGFVVQRIREQNYHSEFARLKDAQIEFSEKSREKRKDIRVQQRINLADDLKEKAIAAKSTSRYGDATDFLKQATEKINEAGHIVDDLKRLESLVTPLVKILAIEDEDAAWNQAPVITAKLAELNSRYQKIQPLVTLRHQQKDTLEHQLPDQAWNMLADLMPDLVELIQDNQQAFEIEELLSQLTALTAAVAPELKDQHPAEYSVIKISQKRAQRYFSIGDWDAARRELSGGINSIGDGALALVEQFLDKYESAEQRQQRLASSADQIAAQVAVAESLRKQVKQMQTQLQAYKDALVDSSRYKKERDEFQQKFDSASTQLVSTNGRLNELKATFDDVSRQRSELAELSKRNQTKLADLQSRLQKGTNAWKQQSAELAKLQSEFEQKVKLIEKLSKGDSHSAKDAEAAIVRAALVDAAKQYQPKSWDQANDTFIEASKKYQRLTQQLAQERQFKQDFSEDVRRIIEDQQAQFSIVVSCLKKRDQQDRDAFDAHQSQIDVAVHDRDHLTKNKGWKLNHPDVLKLDAKIRSLRFQQKPHQSGRDRLAKNAYDFKDWSELSSLSEVKLAQALATFGDLKLGTRYTNSMQQEFVYLPGGTFQMGSPAAESGRDDDENQHSVTLTRGFFVATTETTQRVYSKLTGDSPWSGKDYVREGQEFPAIYVSWNDCNAFIEKLNSQERETGYLPPGWHYRLLTEAEWEYAARAGSKTRFCFGDDENRLSEFAWFEANAWDIGQKYAHKVGTKKPNQWGLYDMHGNCWEWTTDVYDSYVTNPATDPLVENGGSFRVGRGGSFLSSSYCRSANRSRFSPGNRNDFLGFRLALVQQVQ